MGDTRERLLEVAWEVVDRVGARELALADVARAAGISRQAVYLHFGNRATLLLEMLRQTDRSSGFLGRLIATRALEPRPGFIRMLEEWFGYMPAMLPVALALEAAVIAGNEGADGYTARMAEWRGAVRLSVVRLQKANELSSRWDVEGATDWVCSHTLPAFYAELVTVRGWEPEDLAGRTISALEAELLESR